MFSPRSYPLWMMFLAIWKASRRLRGSLSPSIDWTKPNTKSAPRPFSSVVKWNILFSLTAEWNTGPPHTVSEITTKVTHGKQLHNQKHVHLSLTIRGSCEDVVWCYNYVMTSSFSTTKNQNWSQQQGLGSPTEKWNGIILDYYLSLYYIFLFLLLLSLHILHILHISAQNTVSLFKNRHFLKYIYSFFTLCKTY